jgi:hypothetical protein
LTRLVSALVFSIASLPLGASAAPGDTKTKPAQKPSAAPAKPAPSPAAAAPASGKLSEAEQVLRDRASAYWKLRSTTNLHACYPFYEAPFRASTADQFATDFRRLNRLRRVPGRGGPASTLGAKATVKVKLRTHPDVLRAGAK